MKLRRSAIRRQAHTLPELQFANQSLTSFSGLVLFQQLFAALHPAGRLRTCFQLLAHLLLGFRNLRDSRAYRDDPLVKRLLGWNRLPDVSTLSRLLQHAEARTVENVRRLLRDLVFERLVSLGLTRLPLDFDGSVQSPRRHAEGAAVGYDKQRKGERSYYSLCCTVAQTSQVLDLLHRSGNVHDSNGAREFRRALDIGCQGRACIHAVRTALPGIRLEVRLDSAFFSDAIVLALRDAGVEFSLSVPFERFTELKRLIEQRRHWRRGNGDVAYFEADWKPKAWDRRFRFLFIRTRAVRQDKEPIQLDLFIPHETGYDFKVIVSNKTLGAAHVVAFHEGRGSPEGIFGELKTHCQMGHVPVRRRRGNELYRLAGLLAHHLTRELQMRTTPPV